MTLKKNWTTIWPVWFPSVSFVLLALLLSACNTRQSNPVSESNPASDRSFVTSQPCAAPCWYGLELDKSTREDLNATLQKLSFVDQSSVSEYVTTWQNDEHAVGVGWSCLPPKKESCGGDARLSGSKLRSLSLSVDYTLTFSDTVKKLGSPGRVFYVDAFWRGECYIELYWPAQGITVYGKLPNRCSSAAMKGSPLNPNVQVSTIRYELPALIQEQIASDDRYLAWPGFKEDGFSFVDFVPGGINTWLMILLGLGIVIVLALGNRNWPSPVFSFILAALAVIEPTIRLQFSDVITPMCGAYFFNVLLCGIVYFLAAEAARHISLRRMTAVTTVKDEDKTPT